ncbi:MAG: TonB-dependent receptor [Ignavibacteriae bacterium]|nr:TonB-dependent receptor [Ignavibacteriota bacterium]MCB9242423.1 TonB-dependent receptor [Ignavibacteriales bacterium]
MTALINCPLISSAYCQEVGSLSGLVVDDDSKEVIASATVTLENADTKSFIKTETDISGNYAFADVPAGLYNISSNRIGYVSQSFRILIEDGKKKTFNIFLSPAQIETEKVNVTSSKVELTLQQTPSSINLVESDEIKQKNFLTFDNIMEGVQGVTVNRSSGINVSSLSIRGSSDVAGGGIGNRVLLLLDGRPSLTGDSKGALWSLIPISMIERTEVVKGAFSSLYGSSAIGGVVNVITKKPTYKPSLYVNLNYGFYEKLPNSQRFSNDLLTYTGADVLHSNTIGKFSYLFNLDYKQSDGHAQQTDYEFYGINSKFTYDVIDNRDLEVSLQYTNSKSGYPHYWSTSSQPYKVATYYLGDEIDKQTQSFDVYYRAFPNTKSKYSTRFYYYGLNSNSFYNPNNPVSRQFAPSGQGLDTYIDSYNFGNISQFDMQIGKSNYLIAGLDAQWNIVRSQPADILYGDQQMNNFGIFAQDKIDLITDKFSNPVLSTTLGARLDYNLVVSGIESFQVSPKISFLYTPEVSSGVLSNTSFRLLGGRAFRAPSIAELYFKKELFGGFDFVYNPDLKPEEMYSIEFGLRKQFRNRFTFDAAVFYNLYDNLIQYRNIGTGVYGPFQVQNVADAEIKGFEFYIDYNSTLNVSGEPFGYYFNVGYTYMDAKDTSPDRADDLLPYKPKNNLNFTTNFDYYGFNLNIYGRYLSKVEEVIFYRYEEPQDYFLLNAKLSKQLTSNFSIFIGANNILDESYQELERIQAPNRNFNSGVNIQF